MTRSFRRFAVLAALASTTSLHPVAAQPTPPAKPAPSADTPARIRAVLSAPLFKHAVVGVYVRSLDNGRTLFEQNPDTSLMPASNMKIVTAAAALGILGPDYTYMTSLLGGTVGADGTLSGDLTLRGDGDPSLTSERLHGMVRSLKGRGVKFFSGAIVTDTSRFDDAPLGRGWQWDNEADYYQPQISALCLDENVIGITVAPGSKINDPARVTLSPPTAYVPVRNVARTWPEGVQSSVAWGRPRASNEYRITGGIAVNAKPQTESLTLENPARYAATRLWELMAQEGITLPTPPARRIRSGVLDVSLLSDERSLGANLPLLGRTFPLGALPKNVLAESRSKPLSALLTDFLKPSDNLYGECLLKTIGAHTGAVGSATSGAKAITDFLKRPGIEVSTDGIIIADGSGLSRNNQLTARFLVELLTSVDRSFPLAQKEIFLKALPVGGVDGTLRNRFKGTPAEGNVRAKTGSLTGVSALSGYLTTRAGERLVFSILMNNYAASGTTSEARAAQDKIVLALIDAPR